MVCNWMSDHRGLCVVWTWTVWPHVFGLALLLCLCMYTHMVYICWKYLLPSQGGYSVVHCLKWTDSKGHIRTSGVVLLPRLRCLTRYSSSLGYSATITVLEKPQASNWILCRTVIPGIPFPSRIAVLYLLGLPFLGRHLLPWSYLSFKVLDRLADQ